jgi:hypothetical protein
MKTIRRYTQGILFGGVAEYLHRVSCDNVPLIILLCIGAGIMYDIIDSFGDE